MVVIIKFMTMKFYLKVIQQSCVCDLQLGVATISCCLDALAILKSQCSCDPQVLMLWNREMASFGNLSDCSQFKMNARKNEQSYDCRRVLIDDVLLMNCAPINGDSNR